MTDFLDIFSFGTTLSSFMPDNEAGRIAGNILNPIGAISNFASGKKQQEAPDYGKLMGQGLTIVGLGIGGFFAISLISKVVKKV